MHRDPALREELARLPHAPIGATVVGAHLYGFGDADSGVDLRAVHVLPARAVVGLRTPPLHHAWTALGDGGEIELVSHDLGKVARMLLKKNGNVLEQLCSPLVVHRTPAFDRLRAIAPRCAATHHAHHFASHARLQGSLDGEQGPHRVQTVLHTARALLSGIHLMRTGRFEGRLEALTDDAWIGALLERRRAEGADARLDDAQAADARERTAALHADLTRARDASALPPMPPDEARDALDDLLVGLRMEGAA